MTSTSFFRTGVTLSDLTRYWPAAALLACSTINASAALADDTATGQDAANETASYETTENAPRSEYLSSWLNQNVTVIGSKNIRFGPQQIDDIYLEYEFAGRKGPWDLYGYIDFPKFFGIGNDADNGIFDNGSPVFAELEPRLSINEVLDKDLSVGPFKEWYLAADYIFDWGHNSDNRQNTLYAGVGTDIETGTPLGLSVNLYKRYQWENYGAANENQWDGYRAQVKYFLALATFGNGAKLDYVGFTNFDFGSDLGDKAGATRTNEATVATNVLLYSFTHLRFMAVARYFHNGGQWNDDATLDFGDGPFHVRSTGWGYYFGVGWQF
ncbi:nucleoside-specific channel-forming protein Tsx [Larsenimonas salina]|uniref:nucleoside-specific channel-forming protein Tsx n=1 Tax=Larsenimonas salina TaxID=1295565 RepID=UPI0020740B54|nr:nucleoside-specific channel-forming protein Tsx [Larsenimonas salina]MCM5703551.1 nucleoside-specific channel-forming protein Tsx [Larsenimonas salina]